MTDLLIRHVAAVTVDQDRRIIEDAAIAISGDRITAVGRATPIWRNALPPGRSMPAAWPPFRA